MKPTRKQAFKHLRTSDLRGVAQLATQATVGVTRIAEGVHQAVWSVMGAQGGAVPGSTRGIAGLVYRGIRGASEWVGQSLDKSLAPLESRLASADAAQPETPQREAVLAALNGVLGDRLAAANSPFATPMTLRLRGQALDWKGRPAADACTSKVVLLVHGLCMNDLQWQVPSAPPAESGKHPRVSTSDYGAALAAALGATPVYLRYNTGRHISQNGQDLAAQLEQLVDHWPVALEEITVVAHSMGGLVH